MNRPWARLVTFRTRVKSTANGAPLARRYRGSAQTVPGKFVLYLFSRTSKSIGEQHLRLDAAFPKRCAQGITSADRAIANRPRICALGAPQNGHMGDTTYRRHGLQPRAERVVEGLQGPLFQIDIRSA